MSLRRRLTALDNHGFFSVRDYSLSVLTATAPTNTKWLPQAPFVFDAGGQQLVSEIFQLEALRERWPDLQQRVTGLATLSYEQARELPCSENSVEHPQPSEFYESGLKAFVARVYAD